LAVRAAARSTVHKERPTVHSPAIDPALCRQQGERPVDEADFAFVDYERLLTETKRPALSGPSSRRQRARSRPINKFLDQLSCTIYVLFMENALVRSNADVEEVVCRLGSLPTEPRKTFGAFGRSHSTVSP